MDMDSFEARSLKRSGDTKIPEVKATRDAFFNQETYILRGCESKYAFDGKNDTFFDGLSKTDGSRDDGGCLRVDFGGVYNADYLAIEYFDVYEPIRECVKQEITPRGDFSTDLATFRESYLYSLETVCNDEVGVLAERVHNIIKCKGRRCRACYEISGEIRYFRLPRPVDRIYKISLIKNGVELQLDNPHVNNLLPSCKGRQVFAAREAVVRVTGDIYRKGCYIAVSIAGVHGVEGAYAIAEDDNGKLYGFPGRAPSYLCNAWETRAIASQCTDRMYTYYLPVSESMVNRDLKIRVVLCNRDHNAVFADVYLCDANNERKGVIIDL